MHAFRGHTTLLRSTKSDDLEIFERMCKDKHVYMACSSRVAAPMFIGILRPVIVLPQLAYIRNGMDRELMNILRHELTHYRRKDMLNKWLVVVVTSIRYSGHGSFYDQKDDFNDVLVKFIES